jgi:hypothetical protein
MDTSNKNFGILLINLAIISYMLAGLPKLFSILSPYFSSLFQLTKPQFDTYLYNATFFSLFGKTVFSFLLNSKKFEQWISLPWLFLLMIVLHGLSMVLCTLPYLSIHIIGRYSQGLWAGILTVLLEPIIFNCSDSQNRKKLLYLKYELIALLTPIAILITTMTGSFWQFTFGILATVSVVAAMGIFFCKTTDNYYIAHQNNLLSFRSFFESLLDPKLFIDNVNLGGILAVFLVLIQNHFYHLDVFKSIGYLPLRGFLQGIPFTISFIIANLRWRHWFKTNVLFFIGINGLIWILGNHWLPMALVVNGLYIIYVVWMPDMLNNLLINKPDHISHRSISTASQVVRSFSTLFVCKILSRFYENNLYVNFTYKITLGFYLLINFVLLFQKRSNWYHIVLWLLSILILIKGCCL